MLIQAILLWETLQNNSDLGLFHDSDFARDLEDSKSTSGGILCIFGSQTFVPISWMCKKQTSVSHSFTEAELISLDAGSRMDGIPALTLWGLVIEVFHSSPNQTNKTKDVRESNIRKPNPTTNTNPDLTNNDHIPSSGTHSGSNAMLYVFEDFEAVIKMIIKGRIPTMKHVSRTHRVALDWLFDRINLDPQNQIRHIDTKHQLADILTKGNFTRDEWNNLLHLFNISHLSSTCCAKNSFLISCCLQPQIIKQYSRSSGGSTGENTMTLSDSDVNMATWSVFLNATLRAAVHLGQDCEVKLRYVKNNLWNSIGQFFRETGKLISEQKEITDVSTLDFQAAAWMQTSLLCEKSLSVHQRQKLRLLRLCALRVKNGR